MAIAATSALLATVALASCIVAVARAAPPVSPHAFQFGPIVTAAASLLWSIWGATLLAPQWRQCRALHRTLIVVAMCASVLLLAQAMVTL